ncbi:DUF1064 domain-containing protein [Desulfosporosinus sp. FKA]|uniref:DUF1064 domain-containing protein n=1 Tax=Desulfosporosinus sp. FKA TaxID=1969834 RepID=UPI000B4A4679|nr:DUF1064 domain-containing protein [Desulfosporosinus sp. FKA]
MGKRSKHNVDLSETGKVNRTYNGMIFDSRLEKDFYIHLLELQAEGKVFSIQLQPRYKLFNGYVRKRDGKKILPIFYIADFKVTYSDGRVEVIDTKGNPDSLALMKRKMFEGLYPDVDFHWVSWSKRDGGFIDYDELVRLRKQRKKNKVKTIPNQLDQETNKKND